MRPVKPRSEEQGITIPYIRLSAIEGVWVKYGSQIFSGCLGRLNDSRRMGLKSLLEDRRSVCEKELCRTKIATTKDSQSCA